MKWIMTAVLAMLVGCGTVPEAHVPIPASLIQECGALNKLDGMTGKDMLKNIVSNAQIYHECADGKKALIMAVSSEKDKPKK